MNSRAQFESSTTMFGFPETALDDGRRGSTPEVGFKKGGVCAHRTYCASKLN
jgi:hypothetical protein